MMRLKISVIKVLKLIIKVKQFNKITIKYQKIILKMNNYFTKKNCNNNSYNKTL